MINCNTYYRDCITEERNVLPLNLAERGRKIGNVYDFFWHDENHLLELKYRLWKRNYITDLSDEMEIFTVLVTY